MTHILLVCTGNICRSPLAEALMRREFHESAAEDVTVISAGSGAWDGASASEGALLVALENGLDLSSHRARLLTRKLVDDAEIILTMARHHRTRVHELGGEGKTHVLGEYVGLAGPEAEVGDPFGAGIDVYRETHSMLETLIRQAAERITGERSEPDTSN